MTKLSPSAAEQAIVPGDLASRAEALSAVVYGLEEPPTLAFVAEKLRWPVLAVAEAVGEHYWMFLTGSLSDPHTTMVECDGE